MFKAPQLRNYLLFTFLLIVAIPLALLSGFHAWSFSEREEKEEVVRLEESARGIAGSIEDLLTNQRRGIDAAAAQMTRIGKSDPKLLAEIVQETGKRFDGFVSMIVIDDQGRVIAQTLVDERGAPVTLPLGRSVADREYFTEVMRTRQPFTSNAFLGRGYSPEPIVAMSAPVFLPGGKMLVLEGSVNLYRLRNLVAPYRNIEEGRFLVLDGAGRVVHSTESLGLKALEDLSRSPLLSTATHHAAAEKHAFISAEGEMESWVAHANVKSFGWHVFVSQPTSVLREHSLQYYGVTVLLAAVAIILAMLAARFIASSITQPIEQMVQSLATFTKSGKTVPVNLTPNTPVEIVSLAKDFDEMTGRLGRVLGDILPICASCKKIRDDDAGDWKSMDAYITTHTSTQLTHGVCPDCMARLYPDYVEKEKAQRS